MTNVHILGISGSLSKSSYNTALLLAAAELLPAGATLEIADLAGLPIYNDDLQNAGEPDAVIAFRARVAAADALLIATPEHNYSISAALKNAIDWASRPPAPPLFGKPTAIMGASTGTLGTTKAQMHLRNIGVYTNLHFVNKPEVVVGQAKTKFDAGGKLTDETTRGLVRDLVKNLVDWTIQLKK